MWREATARALHQIRRFRWAITPDEAQLVRSLLGPAELRLYLSLQARERRHAVNVVHTLRAAGAPSRELQVAALLHNVGKGSLHLHERVLHVLLAALAPGVLTRIADEDARGLRGALGRQLHHERRGARFLVAAGSRARVVELVANHHRVPGDDIELAALQAADRLN